MYYFDGDVPISEIVRLIHAAEIGSVYSQINDSDEPRLAQYLEDWRLGARRQLPAAILAAILSVSVRLIGKTVNRNFFG